MSNLEKTSENIAQKIVHVLNINDNDKLEVLAYGTFVLIQTMVSILMIAIFGIVFNVLLEAMVISFAASILRKFSGGAHAKSPINCAMIGMIIFGLLAILVKNYIMLLPPSFIVFGIILINIFTYIIIHILSPVGTPTKPLKNENTRKRLKKKSKRFVLIIFIVSVSLIILYIRFKFTYLLTIACSISVGFAWQSITLVSLGHSIIDGLDKVLGGTNRLLRRIIL